MKSDAATMEAFAQYLIEFVQAYALQGITIEAISAAERAELHRDLPDLRLVAGDLHDVHRPVPRPGRGRRRPDDEDHARHLQRRRVRHDRSSAA